MLLAHYGVPSSRAQAQRRFGAAPVHWRGATHAQIAGAVAAALPTARLRWHRVRASTAAALRYAIARTSSDRTPILVTAACVLRHRGLRCRHAFLATAHANGIGLIDPLAARPRPGSRFNAAINLHDTHPRDGARVSGAVWDIDLTRAIFLLRVSLTRRRDRAGSSAAAD